jgi:hypothetical protein
MHNRLDLIPNLLLFFKHMDFIPKKEIYAIQKHPEKTNRKGTFVLLFLLALLTATGAVGGWYQKQKHVSEVEILKRELAIAAIPNETKSTTPMPNYGVWPELSGIEFFNTVKATYISKKVDFIEANLSEMQMHVFKKGQIVKSVPIKTKGKEGSWWETPSGLYKVELKKENHLSSLGGVYMPWSIQFQGNFFIHGWPYYPDKTPVAGSFSGGCIRLESDDAKAIYNLATEEMPILVHEDDFTADTFTHLISAPEISASSYLVADIQNNFVMLSSNEVQELPSYTVPKLLTGLVASEYINIENKVSVFKNDLVPSTKSRLKVGESYSVYDLLHPLIIENSSEAAEVIANAFSSSRLENLTEKKMGAVGMEDSIVTSPSGWDGKSVSNTSDMFRLLKYVYNNRPFLLSLSGNQKNAYPKPKISPKTLSEFGADKAYLGGIVAKEPEQKITLSSDKQTSAVMLFATSTTQNNRKKNLGQDAMVVFEIQFQNELRPIAIIVLDSSNPTSDVQKMRSYVTERYK